MKWEQVGKYLKYAALVLLAFRAVCCVVTLFTDTFLSCGTLFVQKYFLGRILNFDSELQIALFYVGYALLTILMISPVFFALKGKDKITDILLMVLFFIFVADVVVYVRIEPLGYLDVVISDYIVAIIIAYMYICGRRDKLAQKNITGQGERGE